jgi:hypothetical protein
LLGKISALAAVYYCGDRGGADVGLFSRLAAAQAGKRQRADNARTRVEELRMIVRRGDPDEHRIYQTACNAWDAAGQPDVPLITEWFAKRQAVSRMITELTDQDS